MKRIAVLTSGGDAPGMNAAVRAVVRMGAHFGFEVFGVEDGYTGLVSGAVEPLNVRSVANIIQRGGTILGTSRCDEFMEPEGRVKAANTLRENEIEGLVAIGGDGTFRGAKALFEEHGVAVVGVPGTIDNDIHGTDFTIGFDTAVNTALEAIDRIRDTAQSHERVHFVEVMGRHAGSIALEVGLAGGAEDIIIPETPTIVKELAWTLENAHKREKLSSIVVVAEGDEAGDAFSIAWQVNDLFKIEYRVTVLGHIQRGGSPTARDRVLAARLGAASVDALLQGETNCMVGEVGSHIRYVSLEETWNRKKQAPIEDLTLTRILAE